MMAKCKKMAEGGSSEEGFDFSKLKIVPREESVGDKLPAKKLDQGERHVMPRKTGQDWLDMKIASGKSALPEEQKGMGEFSKGGKVSSASKRADGCAVKGKTKGRIV